MSTSTERQIATIEAKIRAEYASEEPDLEAITLLRAEVADLRDSEALDIAASICQDEAEEQDRLAREVLP